MWQTAMRGFGADWTLTQYFVFYCLNWGKVFRPEDVVRWATMGGAEALAIPDLVGSLTPGKKADVVLVKNDASPATYPILHPHGHVVFQAGRGDVHTVLVDGRVVKHDGQPVEVDLQRAKDEVGRTIEYLQGRLGDEEWHNGLTPELPEQELSTTRTSTRTGTAAAAHAP